MTRLVDAVKNLEQILHYDVQDALEDTSGNSPEEKARLIQSHLDAVDTLLAGM